MTRHIMPRWLAQDAFQNTGVGEWRDEHLINDYNGRGMGRERCFALVGDQRLLVKFMVALAELEFMSDPDNCEVTWATLLADSLNSDSMGRDMVYYFPDIKLSET